MTVLYARLRGLPQNLRGALWMLLSAFAFSLMDASIKLVGQGLDSFQIAFFRSLFGGLAILPFALRMGRAAFRTKRLGGHFGRATCGYMSMALGFYGITHLPLADAVALSFTRPLFMIVLAVLILGEVVRWRRWSATIVGFMGVLIMARPGASGFDPAMAASMTGAMFAAGVGVLIKRLATTERPETIIIYFTTISSLLALGPALYVWRTPTPAEFAMLLVIGALGSLGQYFSIRSYRIAEATAVEPIDYSRLVFATALGFAIFAELPDAWTLVGAFVIVASTLYIARREARLRRKAEIAHAAGQPGTAPPIAAQPLE